MQNSSRGIFLVSFFVVCLFFGCNRKADVSLSTEAPENEKSVSSTCRFYEKYDHNRKLCWDRCVIGERWTGKDCRAVNYHKALINYDSAVASCKSLGARLPRVEEFESLLDKCFDAGSAFQFRQCDLCRESEECMNFLGDWFIEEGIGLWASGANPRRVYLFNGKLTPREYKYDPDEREMWAVCVRDIN